MNVRHLRSACGRVIHARVSLALLRTGQRRCYATRVSHFRPAHTEALG